MVSTFKQLLRWTRCVLNYVSWGYQVRREKISERMKFLQDLVPGCSKVLNSPPSQTMGSQIAILKPKNYDTEVALW